MPQKRLRIPPNNFKIKSYILLGGHLKKLHLLMKKSQTLASDLRRNHTEKSNSIKQLLKKIHNFHSKSGKNRKFSHSLLGKKKNG